VGFSADQVFPRIQHIRTLKAKKSSYGKKRENLNAAPTAEPQRSFKLRRGANGRLKKKRAKSGRRAIRRRRDEVEWKYGYWGNKGEISEFGVMDKSI